MKDEDIQNLLGGFATDTLTERERELLFTAALTNQELFNALADDQALREFLDDPASRRQLLQALQPQEPGVFERLTSWMRRPAAWAAAATVMAALVVAVAVRQPRPPTFEMAKTAAPTPAPAQISPSAPVREEPKPAPTLSDAVRPQFAEARKARRDSSAPAAASQPLNAPGAAPAPSPPAAAPAPPPAAAAKDEKAVAEPAPSKLKVAVLDFESNRAKEADGTSADEGKKASDLLGKKLDSSGYTVIDRKQVDQALQAQNLSRRQLDPSTAASVGRSVGADAVIVGSVTNVKQTAQKAKTARAIAGLRATPAAPSRAAAAEDVQVTAQAFNTQTASNLGVAVSQGEQIPGGGLAGAVDQVASSLGQQIQQNARLKIDGLVTDVNAAILTLNVGAKAGVKVGDRLEVRRAGKPIGRVVISTVKDSFSVGAFEGTGPVKIGDSVVNLQ